MDDKLRSGVIQLLIRKYIEKENTFLYNINDSIDSIEEQMDLEWPVVEVFAEEAQELSYGIKIIPILEYLMWKNIYRLISKHAFAKNTEVWILIIADLEICNEFDSQQKAFTELKEKMKTLPEELLKGLFYGFSYYKYSIDHMTIYEAIPYVLERMKEWNDDFRVEISDSDVKKMKENLLKIKIKFIPLEELFETELDKDFIKRFMHKNITFHMNKPFPTVY